MRTDWHSKDSNDQTKKKDEQMAWQRKKRVVQYCGIAAIVAAIASAYSVGMHCGWNAGYRAASSSSRASAFVASFDTLRKLREGDLTNGITRLESFCFSSFIELAENPGDKGHIVVWFKPELAAYRSAFAPQPQEQYATEKKLDELLHVIPQSE